MGRNSKEFGELTRGVLEFKLSDESTQKKLTVCRRLLESIIKSRGCERKQMYKTQLDNCFKNLCADVTHHEKKLLESNKTIDRLQKNVNQLEDKYHRLALKLKDQNELTARLADYKQQLRRREPTST